MKRKRSLFLYTLPLFLLGALVVSCGGESTTDPEEEQDSGSSEITTPGDGTLAGAGLDDIYDYNEDMDGSTRPNYGDIFDYESEYEPDVPDPTGTVQVTFVLPEGVTLTEEYVNYYSEVEVYGNIYLPTGDSEYLVYTTDTTVEGWAAYDQESDTYTFISSVYYGVGREDVVLYAYVNDSRGYDVTELSRVSDTSSSVMDYAGNVTYDDDGNVAEITTRTVSGYSWRDHLINGKYGSRITYEGTLEDDFARIVSVPATEFGSIEANVDYEIYYTLVNYGSETIEIQLSQIRSYANYTSGVMTDWYQIAPGASVDITLVFDSQSPNDHLLTGYVVKGTVNDFDLGFQMAMDISSEYANTTLTLGNDHAYLSDGIEQFTIGNAPSNDEFNTSTAVGDRTLLGWYYDDATAGRVIVSSLRYIKSSTDLTVYPYFSEYSDYTKVTIASGYSNRKNTGGHSSVDEDNVETISSDTAVNGDNGVAELGSSIIINQALTDSDYFRFDSTGTMTEDTYSFLYSFENYGEERISFTLYQINSQRNTESFTGHNNATVTLDPGCYGTVQLVATSTGTNTNLLSYFVWGSTNTSVHFKMSLQYRLATNSDVAKTSLEVLN